MQPLLLLVQLRLTVQLLLLLMQMLLFLVQLLRVTAADTAPQNRFFNRSSPADLNIIPGFLV
jgi:hypothetical protein